MVSDTDLKNVNLDFFQVQITKSKSINAKKAETKPFDLTKWMDMVRPKYENDPVSVSLNFYGEQVRCDYSGIYGVGTSMPLARLHFTKLREKNTPAIGSIHDVKLDPVNLKPDEYIAEDVTALFDPSNSVLMLQKNIYSLSRRVLEAYITQLWNEGNEDSNPQYIHLVPIFQKDNFRKGKRGKNFESISFKTANKTTSATFSNPFKGAIGSIFDTLKPLSCMNIEIKISASKKKKEYLDNKGTIDIITEIERDKERFKKAGVSFESDNAGLTHIDLMDAKLHSVLPFNVPKKRPLNPNAVWTSMLGNYKPDGDNMVNIVNSNLY